MSRPAEAVPLAGIGALLGVGFLAALGTQAYQQTAGAERTLKLAETARRRTTVIVQPARRGSILDRSGKALAADSPVTELSLVSAKVPRSDGFFLDVSRVTGVPASELRTAVATSKSRGWRVRLDYRQRAELDAVVERWRADGLSTTRTGERSYPLGPAASSLVGFTRRYAQTGKDKRPGTVVTGLESRFGQELQGQDGRTEGFLDRRGFLLPNRVMRKLQSKRDGADLRLTLDAPLQRAAFEALRRKVDEVDAESGTVVVVSPQTGEIYALANYPSIEPDDRVRTQGKPATGVNPAYMERFEPGSTFKILTLAMALEEGKTHLHELFHCGGAMRLGKRTIHCDRAHGAHGTLDSEKAIAVSCNLDAARWALAVGRPRSLEYMRQLGLFERSGLGLDQEARGSYNDEKEGRVIQLATYGFGQSLACTPLTLAGAFATLANDGRRVRLKLVEEIGGELAPSGESQTVFSSRTAEQVMAAMTRVFEDPRGTARGLRIPGYRLAGKTGTAEKIGGDAKAQGKRYVSNFIGFVPAQNPKAVVLVMINNPDRSKGYYGGAVAGPVFRAVALSAIERLRIPANDPAAFQAWKKGGMKPLPTHR